MTEVQFWENLSFKSVKYDDNLRSVFVILNLVNLSSRPEKHHKREKVINL